MGLIVKKCWYFCNPFHENTAESSLMTTSMWPYFLKMLLPLLNAFNNTRCKMPLCREILLNRPTLFDHYSHAEQREASRIFSHYNGRFPRMTVAIQSTSSKRARI